MRLITLYLVTWLPGYLVTFRSNYSVNTLRNYKVLYNNRIKVGRYIAHGRMGVNFIEAARLKGGRRRDHQRRSL